MRPAEVLDMHADLLDRLTYDTGFREIIRLSFTADYEAATRHRTAQKEQEILDNSYTLTRIHTEHVRSADNYRVTEQMTDLVVHLAENDMGTEDTWQPTLAPSPTGIVRFDKPLLVTEVRGRTMKAHWLVWGPTVAETPDRRQVQVTLLTWYNDLHDPDEVGLGAHGLENPDVRRTLGRWAWIGAEYLQTGKPLGTHLVDVPEEVAQEVRDDGDTPVAQSTHLPRYAYMLWLVMGQTLATKTIEEPDRAGRRRAIRKNIPPRVTVVRLRRRDHAAEPGETQVEWHHRWIVKQHRRWQPRGPHACTSDTGHEYGPIVPEPGLLTKRCTHCGDAYLAWILIDPYVKGPEGAPLKQSTKIYDLSQ